MAWRPFQRKSGGEESLPKSLESEYLYLLIDLRLTAGRRIAGIASEIHQVHDD